jgi:hypothetical protein
LGVRPKISDGVRLSEAGSNLLTHDVGAEMPY